MGGRVEGQSTIILEPSRSHDNLNPGSSSDSASGITPSNYSNNARQSGVGGTVIGRQSQCNLRKIATSSSVMVASPTQS